MIQYQLTEQAKQLKEAGTCDCTPVRGTPLSAGMDLKACLAEPLTIYPMQTVKVMTGVKVFLGGTMEWMADSMLDGTEDVTRQLPITLCGFYLPRSSNKGLQLENTVGLLDVDFKEESFVKLYNKTEEPIIILPGDRLVQLVVVPAIMQNWLEVPEFQMISSEGELVPAVTERSGGDGSTGRN